MKTNTSCNFSQAKHEVIQTSRKPNGSVANLNLMFDGRKTVFQPTVRTFRCNKESNKWSNGKDWSKIEPNAGNWVRIYPYTYNGKSEPDDADKALRNIAFNVAKFNKVCKEIFRKNVKECDDDALNFLLQSSLGMKTQVWCPPL